MMSRIIKSCPLTKLNGGLSASRCPIIVIFRRNMPEILLKWDNIVQAMGDSREGCFFNS